MQLTADHYTKYGVESKDTDKDAVGPASRNDHTPFQIKVVPYRS